MPPQAGVQPGMSRRGFLKRASGLAAVALATKYGLRPAPAFALTEDSLPARYTEKGILRGGVPLDQRFQIKGLLAQAGIEYACRQLPDESAAYGGYWYQVRPETIWWHWDGGPTPSAEYKDRVFATYWGLAGRTRRGDPVSTHFCVGPGKVLQMLPLSATHIIQGRLSDDSGIEEVLDALSLGGIQIETTGSYYARYPPTEIQTETLVRLTYLLMKQYGVSFKGILGHFERSPWARKRDPSLAYTRNTRLRLLRVLLEAEEFDLMGPPSSWQFYELVGKKHNKLAKVTTQTSDELLDALTPAERETLQAHFGIEAETPPAEQPVQDAPSSLY